MKPKPFNRVDATDNQSYRLNLVRRIFAVVLSVLIRQCPAGRYRSVAVTQLETAAMFATKSITHDEDLPELAE